MRRCSQSVFVIRMWWESAVGDTAVQRGYVEHVATGRRFYFSDIEDALEFVTALGPVLLDRADDGSLGTDEFESPRTNAPAGAGKERTPPAARAADRVR